MGDERARPVLTPFEEVAGALQAAERAPTLLAVDADSVLWPCSCDQFAQGQAQPSSEALQVLAALLGRGVKVALLGSSKEPSKVEAKVKATGDLGHLIAFHHITQAEDSMQGVEGASAPAAAQAPLGPQQQEVERHWKELRLVTGVSWSEALALCGSASTLRAANRAGAGAALQVGPTKGGLLSAQVMLRAIELFVDKAADSRGF